jgi:hypothetical protein
VATPTSAIPPDLASGEILKKGTAVVTIFTGLVCAEASSVAPYNNIKDNIATLNECLFISYFFKIISTWLI